MLNRASAPFLWSGGAAVVAGGLVAAAVAHAPTQPLVWMVAYLVLVVGVVQIVLAAGQARLAVVPPVARRVWTRWWLFNLGNAGVIAGTLMHRFAWVAAGTIAFALALVMFAAAVHGGRRGRVRGAYLALVVAMLVSSLVGVALSLRTP